MTTSPDPVTGRCTPYELIFASAGLTDSSFPQIEEEVRSRGIDARNRAELAMLGSVGLLLQRLVPDDVSPAALDYYLALLFHCYHFWKSDCPVYAFEIDAFRSVIESPPGIDRWQPSLTRDSQYFEFPRQICWAQVDTDLPPEPVEGTFLRFDSEKSPAEFDLFVVLGMRPDRDGISALDIQVGADQPPEPPGATDFRADIPGAELAGLYSVSTPGDVATLLRFLLRYLELHPDAIDDVAGATDPRPRVLDPKGPTTLDHYRVRLVERSDE